MTTSTRTTDPQPLGMIGNIAGHHHSWMAPVYFKPTQLHNYNTNPVMKLQFPYHCPPFSPSLPITSSGSPSDLYILHTYASHPLTFPLPMTVTTSYSFSLFDLLLRSTHFSLHFFIFLWHGIFGTLTWHKQLLKGEAWNIFMPWDLLIVGFALGIHEFYISACFGYSFYLFPLLLYIRVQKKGGDKKAKNLDTWFWENQAPSLLV